MADTPDFTPPDWAFTIPRRPAGVIVLRGRPSPKPSEPGG
jgi:hypothetical protein